MRFQIRRSINNIYSAVSIPEGKEYTCRIKGKFLKGSNEYNPVAVGDVAIGEPYSPNEALITEIEERRSGFTRWNVKAFLNQTIASNQDQTAIVLSSVSPPFRPRFVDRAIASSWGADILLIMNKADFGLDEFEEERSEIIRKYESEMKRLENTIDTLNSYITALKDTLLTKDEMIAMLKKKLADDGNNE